MEPDSVKPVRPHAVHPSPAFATRPMLVASPDLAPGAPMPILSASGTPGRPSAPAAASASAVGVPASLGTAGPAARPAPQRIGGLDATGPATTGRGVHGRLAGGPHRIDLPCGRLGFTPPPAVVHVRFITADATAVDGTGNASVPSSSATPEGGSEGGATAAYANAALQVRCAAAALAPTLRWLAEYAPESVQVPPGLAPCEATATFATLPATWASLLAAVQVQAVELAPDGSATIFVDGTAAQLAQFGLLVGAPGSVARSRPSRAAADPRLTPAQAATLAKAVALGYYDIPRRADLRTIARQTNRSLASVGEALRRCEEIVVTSFVDRASLARWAPSPGEPTSSNGQHAGSATLEHTAVPGEAAPAIDAF